jgi:HAD superfamily hydrolase (TIGR01509 family)
MAAFRTEQGGGPDDAEIAALHAEKTAAYSRMVRSGGLVPRSGVLRLVAEAYQANLGLAIATTTSPANVDALAHALWRRSASDVFQVIAAGDEVARKKPVPDVYQLALQRLGMAANECLAVEDSLNGVRAAGIAVVAAPSIYSMHEDLADATLVLPDLSELTLPLAQGLISG